MTRLNPPMVTTGPVSGRIFVVTHGSFKYTADDRQIVEATVKYDVSDQIASLARAGLLPAAESEGPEPRGTANQAGWLYRAGIVAPWWENQDVDLHLNAPLGQQPSWTLEIPDNDVREVAVTSQMLRTAADLIDAHDAASLPPAASTEGK